MTYEELLIEADTIGLITKEKALLSADGLIKNNRIAIRQNIPTTAEKACILAEELGHYHTAAGNILDQQDIWNRKQEAKGRLWAYNKQIGLMGIVAAYQASCRSLYEMADYLNVTEHFLKEALEQYQKKYGVCTTVDNYIVYFIPSLAVMEMYPTRNIP